MRKRKRCPREKLERLTVEKMKMSRRRYLLEQLVVHSVEMKVCGSGGDVTEKKNIHTRNLNIEQVDK